MLTVLKTNLSAYVFDPENPELVLKANGKFSSVYLGTRVEDKRIVVIKKLKNPGDYRTSIRFQKESVLGFGYDGVAETLDAHKDESGYYIIREFIDGQSLRKIYRAGVPNPELFFVKCVIGVLEILKEFHDKNIFHCDIRPDNILVVNNKRGNPDYVTPDVRLIDFGLSKNADKNFDHSPNPSRNKFGTSSPKEKGKENVPFSLIYSPPEQVLNYPELVDASSDLFSLGITLFECISKVPPFFNEHPEMVMHLQLNTDIENKNKISDKLFSVLQKATSKKKLRLPPSQLEEPEIIETIKDGKQNRFQNCRDMQHALQGVLTVGQQRKTGVYKKLFRY